MSDPREYRIAVQRRQTEDGVLFEGTVFELPDVAVYAESADDAYEQVIDVIAGLKELFEKQGRSFPPPQEREFDYSGKFLVRIPRYLHRSLAERAEEEGVSLNQYVLSVLSCHTAWAVRAPETGITVTGVSDAYVSVASGSIESRLRTYALTSDALASGELEPIPTFGYQAPILGEILRMPGESRK